MLIRQPVRAGTFYAAAEAQCLADLRDCAPADPQSVQGVPIGGIVPHAGWRFSGKVTGQVFSTLTSCRAPKTVIIFGAVHAARGRQAAMFASGTWETPIGPVKVDTRLAERILGHTNLIVDDPYAHEEEHSIEVQVPFIRHLLPDAMILPIMVSPNAQAPEVGESVARTIQTYRADAVVIGSTDLTHYGPAYGFTPEGVGAKGLTWAKEINDRRMIHRILALDPAAILSEAQRHRNACGAGAIAATMAAARQLGADSAALLQHTTSRDVSGDPSATDAVGYAGILFLSSAPLTA